jgi:hypothetical protein
MKLTLLFTFFFFFLKKSGFPLSPPSHGPTAPSGPGPPHYRGFTIILGEAHHSVGLDWTSDQPYAETST